MVGDWISGFWMHLALWSVSFLVKFKPRINFKWSFRLAVLIEWLAESFCYFSKKLNFLFRITSNIHEITFIVKLCIKVTFLVSRRTNDEIIWSRVKFNIFWDKKRKDFPEKERRKLFRKYKITLKNMNVIHKDEHF